MRINVDMDGVVADFDGHYEHCFGVRPSRWPDPDTVDWGKVARFPYFFATIPMMRDAGLLLAAVITTGLPWRILTGVPKSINAASNEKIEWFRELLTPPPEVLCCRSREKYKHCEPGDILIDDYLKYRHLWEAAGGVFIHHTSAAESVRKLWEHLS